MLGRRIGSWVLTRELGRGGMGAVFEARHVTLQTPAAVKVLSPGLESEEAFRQRFRREAELQAQLRHPNVARMLDYLEDGGRWFLVIEYLDRGSLAETLSRGGKVSHEQAVAWTRQALAGLAHAHKKGIVHRDVKPANLMFNEAGEIVVVDFGIARGKTAPGLTRTGLTIGTPHYMSPEQIETPERIDGRADVYSLGVVLYEMLAGRKPFEGRSDFSLLQAQVMELPPPLRTLAPTIPEALEAVVMRALAKRPDHRFPDCESMARALDRAPEGAVDFAPAAAPPATVEYSRMYERLPTPPAHLPSPGEERDRRRRSFQRRLAAGVVSVVGIAGLLATIAARQGGNDGTPQTPVTASTATTNASDTTHTTTSPVTDHTSDGSSRPNEASVAPVTVGRPFDRDRIPVVVTGPPPLPSPSARPPVLPEHPQIAVIGTGNDPVFAAALEQELEDRLRKTHRVADEHGDPEVGELLRKPDVKPAVLGPQLLKSGFHVLVVVRVEEGDRRTIHIGGERGSMKAARIRLNAYLLPANRTVGTGWTEQVEYAELSVNTKAKNAFIGATADLRQHIDQEWTQLLAANGRQTGTSQ